MNEDQSFHPTNPIHSTLFLPNVYGPITPSQMFERAFRLLRENFKLYAGIVLVLIGVEIVVGGILGGSGLWMSQFAGSGAPMARILMIFPIAFVGAVLLFIIVQIIQGALFIATRAKLADAPMTVGEACKLAADKGGSLIGISLLVALRTIGYLLMFYIAFIVLAAFAAVMFGGVAHIAGSMQLRPGHMPPLGIAAFGGVLLLVFVAFYCFLLLWLVVRYSLAIPATLAENLSVSASIRRSIHLSGGSRGRLYGLFLGIFCFYLVLVAVTVPVQLMVGHWSSMHPDVSATALSIVTMLIAAARFLISAVIVAWIGIATTLCYYDLRARKEGFGIPAAPPLEGPVVTTQPAVPDIQTGDFPAI